MMHPGDDQLYGTEPDDSEEELLRIIDNIRKYTCADVLFTAYWPPRFDATVDEAYVEQGFKDMDEYLAKHLAFAEFMEGSEADA